MRRTPDTRLTSGCPAYPAAVIGVSVLGAVEVHRDGERIPVRAGKSAEVLIHLALQAGVLVRAERLIEDLWADEAAGTARNTLQTKVSALRRALGDRALVKGTSAGYTLDLDPTAVGPRSRCCAWPTAPRALRAAGDPAAVRETCATALAMFSGEVLAGAGEGEWVRPHRTRLEEVRLDLVEGEIATQLDLGAAGDVIPELEALVRTHPLPARACGTARHGAVPRRPAGGCAGRLWAASPAPASPMGSASIPGLACSDSNGSSSRTTSPSLIPGTRALGPTQGEPAFADLRSGRAGRRGGHDHGPPHPSAPRGGPGVRRHREDGPRRGDRPPPRG